LFFALDGTVYLLARNLALFRDPVRQHHYGFPREKVENAVVDSLTARLEFIDAVPKVIGFGSPEFVAELSQSDSRGALQLNLLGQRIEPSEERKRSVFVARIRVFRLISGNAS
jgi:hypothetical protein